jgi:hypothetical protein
LANAQPTLAKVANLVIVDIIFAIFVEPKAVPKSKCQNTLIFIFWHTLK